MKNKNDELSWKEIWEQWKYLKYAYPSLEGKVACENIIIPKENCPSGMIIQGIDWIEADCFEKRIDNVVNHTTSF